MIKININKPKIHYILPIVPNKYKSNVIALDKTILYPDDIKELNFRCTGCFQDLPENIIREVFNREGEINIQFLKNIPEDVIRNLISKKSIQYFLPIIYNPSFKNKYIHFFSKKEVNTLVNENMPNLLKYKSLPENFDIRNFVVCKDEYICYSDEIFNYNHVFDLCQAFLKQAEYDNIYKFISKLPIEVLFYKKLYKEAYEQVKKTNQYEKFLVYFPHEKETVVKYKKEIEEILQYIRNPKRLWASVKKFGKYIDLTKIFEDKKISKNYFKGMKTTIDCLKVGRKTIEKIISFIEKTTNTKRKEIYINNYQSTIGNYETTIINIHFENKIVFQYVRKKKYHRYYYSKFIKLPGMKKITN